MANREGGAAAPTGDKDRNSLNIKMQQDSNIYI